MTIEKGRTYNEVMSMNILSTKLYMPPSRPKVVRRTRLLERLNEGMHRKLTIVSAPAGYGKTTLVAEWLAGCGRTAVWLSLDEGDHDPARFLTYLTAALQTMDRSIGEGVFALLASPQPPPSEFILTTLLNDITSVPYPFHLVLDDYHVLDAGPVDKAITFLLDRMPPQMHLVIATRKDPSIPLGRLRARDQLTELRAADLRFDFPETVEFLGEVMGLSLSNDEMAHLDSRTEGWAAGLQLAALSMKGDSGISGRSASFTSTHPFVLDYLVEEVLKRQPAAIQTFLLRTSILDRFCGPLCDAVMAGAEREQPLPPGQEVLAYLEQANLFLVPLDQEKRWYRYHHLFAELLRQKLQPMSEIAPLHVRASEWLEAQGCELEAFHHAAAAGETARAVRLIEGKGMPLLFRGAVTPILNWLASLPEEELDAWPSLWVTYASALLLSGRLSGVEQKLQAAEKALQGIPHDDKSRDLIGHIASIRATMAVNKHQAETILAESRRALNYLHQGNLPVRTATTWTLGYAYQLLGERTAAIKAYTEALSASQRIGHVMITVMATLGIGLLQEADNRYHMAAETYRHVLALAGDPPLPVACEAHLGLARIHYEWNRLEEAQRHSQQASRLARLLEHSDRVVACEVFLARLKLAQGKVSEAAEIVVRSEHFARQHRYEHQFPFISAVRVQVLLRQGNLTAALQLARKHKLPVSLARAHLAQGDTAAALALLGPHMEWVEAKGWEDERLQGLILEALALHAHGEKLRSLQQLSYALALAEPGGFVRLFLEEGLPMAGLLSEAAAAGIMQEYIGKLLSAMKAEGIHSGLLSDLPQAPSLIEPLTARETEVLRLIALGLSNHEIGERLFISLSTVKGHNRIIFDKLQVKRRTEAVALARKLGLL